MDGATHGSTKISGTRGDVTQVIIFHKPSAGVFLYVVSGTDKTVESNLKVWILHYWDYSHVICLIYPYDQRFLKIMKYAAMSWPICVEVRLVEEPIVVSEKKQKRRS